jgi:hypothetical protein
MTYILGIQKPDQGFSALISDLMVTKIDRVTGAVTKDTTVLKTGSLFPGCIYGLSGNATSGKNFILNIRQLTDKTKSIQANWELLQQHIKHAKYYVEQGDFSVLMSCRASGVPKLYLYKSNENCISEINEELVSIGNGKNLLDKIIELRIKMAEDIIVKQMNQNGIPLLYYPYFYCLWLSEISMGFEASQLENAGVGGLFHFCFQLPDKESRQQPAVYVLSVPDFKNLRIYNYIYRITFVESFLVYDNPLQEVSRIIIPPFEMKDIKSLSATELHSLGERINNEADSQQFYYFCGFGFPSPDYRASFLCHLSCKEERLVVDKQGNIHPDYRKLIERNIASLKGAPDPPLSMIKKAIKK